MNYKALEVEFISRKNANDTSNNGMYIERGNARIKRTALAGFVRVLYTSLHVRAVMPVMSAKQPSIFPHACVSI